LDIGFLCNFWGLGEGGGGFPLTVQSMKGIIRKSFGCDGVSSDRYLSKFRESLRQNTFVADELEIPKGKSYAALPCCWRDHYGVCKTADADIIGGVRDAGSLLADMMSGHQGPTI
jgi:hypothetical protein